MGTEAHLLSEEFELEVDDGVDLYDDMITSSGPGGRIDLESQDGGSPPTSPTGSAPNNAIVIANNSTASIPHDNSIESRSSSSSITPLRKHQAYIGNLTWWTSDRDIQNSLNELGVTDFMEVKFYENRANGQSKGYCVLTVGSDSSLKLIHDKFPKKEIHGQLPVVTPPTKQALNQFEAQAKTRPSATGGGSSGNQNHGGGGNMNMDMNMMGGPRGPMPMPPQMGMGMGFGPGPGPRMMMGPGGPRGPRGMGPPGMGPPPPGHPAHRGMGPNMHNPGFRGPPNQMMPQNLPPLPGPPRMQLMQDPFYQGGPPPQMGPRGPMPPMMDPRGPPFPGPQPQRHEYRPPMNNYPPHGHPAPAPGPGPIRGPLPPQQMQGPPQGAPAPHMNPAFFHPNVPGGPPPGAPYNANGPPGGYPPQMEHVAPPPVINDAEFDEVMSRNRTVSSSAISRAVSDAATGEFASAIETLVTAISLIKQSKVAHDDRCKILVSSLQDTLHGIEAKSYGRPAPRDVISERSRSRERDRHRRSRRERTRSREREYRDRSRDRYYEYPRERERSRSREYRERPREVRDESSRAYYEERYRERAGEREREPVRSSRSEVERPREREPERDRERDPVSHRAPRH